MERVYDEELTFIAEGINRPLQTTFILQEHNGSLSYFDKGKYRPYIGTLITGLETAKHEAAADFRKQFQVSRAKADLATGYQLETLKPGESLFWSSPFPEQETEMFGAEFVGSLGYQPARKLGFLYKATRLANGHLELSTQSVDNSDIDAFEASQQFAADNPTAEINAVREAYDACMAEKYGGPFYAGRRVGGEIDTENAWELICQHTDLVEYFMGEIMALAQSTSLSPEQQERQKKRITYGAWAALKERIDNRVLHIPNNSNQQIAFEVSNAYRILSVRGEELFGCGGALKGEDALLNADPSKVFDEIFGSRIEVLKCVHCPLCNRDGVDATITYHKEGNSNKKTITCSECKESKTYDE